MIFDFSQLHFTFHVSCWKDSVVCNILPTLILKHSTVSPRRALVELVPALDTCGLHLKVVSLWHEDSSDLYQANGTEYVSFKDSRDEMTFKRYGDLLHLKMIRSPAKYFLAWLADSGMWLLWFAF